MATTLLRMGLRSVVSKGVFEKRSISAIGNALAETEQRHVQQGQKFQVAFVIFNDLFLNLFN